MAPYVSPFVRNYLIRELNVSRAAGHEMVEREEIDGRLDEFEKRRKRLKRQREHCEKELANIQHDFEKLQEQQLVRLRDLTAKHDNSSL